METERSSDQHGEYGCFKCTTAQSLREMCHSFAQLYYVVSNILDCVCIQRRGTWSTKTLGTESKRAFQWSVYKERCLCPARLAGPLLHPPWLCLLGYYTFTTQSALSKRSRSNPCKSRLHWRKWLCSVHKCWPCALTRVLEALRQGTLDPQAASQVTGSGLQLGRLCSGRGRR